MVRGREPGKTKRRVAKRGRAVWFILVALICAAASGVTAPLSAPRLSTPDIGTGVPDVGLNTVGVSRRLRASKGDGVGRTVPATEPNLYLPPCESLNNF